MFGSTFSFRTSRYETNTASKSTFIITFMTTLQANALKKKAAENKGTELELCRVTFPSSTFWFSDSHCFELLIRIPHCNL